MKNYLVLVANYGQDVFSDYSVLFQDGLSAFTKRYFATSGQFDMASG